VVRDGSDGTGDTMSNDFTAVEKRFPSQCPAGVYETGREPNSRLLVQQSLEQAGLDPLPVLGGKRLPELEVLGEDSFSQLGRSELSNLVMRLVRR